MYDIAVIGAGPAGLSAAVTASQRGKRVVVVGREIEYNPLYLSEKIDNYLGMPDISGKALLNAFKAHAEKAGVEFVFKRALQCFDMGGSFSVSAGSDVLEARAVILALGAVKSKVIEGESEFLGRGVSYCATCDGMLYKNKTAVLVGEIPECEEDLEFLNKICKKVYFMPLYKYSGKTYDKTEIIIASPQKVTGEKFVTGIKTSKGEFAADGIFFIKKTMPSENLVPGIETEGVHIRVNRNMETNIKNVYAAGDCTGGPYQISKAAGEGLIAGLYAAVALDKK